jgi:hypothetical protein
MAAERPRDLYPLMILEYVVKALKVLFGGDNVISDKYAGSDHFYSRETASSGLPNR